jgi:hypothetical protein
MKEALPWLERIPWIEGYAWFSFEPTSCKGYTSSLFDVNGNLTASGRFYKSVQSDNIDGDQTIERIYKISKYLIQFERGKRYIQG